MIRVQHALPRKLTLAVSGGVDSMVALDFLSKSHDVDVIYYNHNTEYGNRCETFLKDICEEHEIAFKTEKLDEDIPKGVSKEAFWRVKRYDFFKKHYIATSRNIVLGHHLNDCVETFLFNTIRSGKPITIPYRREKYGVIRPFRLTKKQVFLDWAERNSVPYLDDPSNSDTSFDRNYIRHELMPHVLRINKGIERTVARMIENE